MKRRASGPDVLVRFASLAWLAGTWRDALVLILGLAIVLRILLVLHAPVYGYVWDFYQDGISVLYHQGRLPVASDCWACYHPPVFYLAGWPFFAIGKLIRPNDDGLAWRMLSGLSMLSVAVVGYYGVRLLRLVGCRRASLVAGLGLTLSVPLLFIASNGPDADVLLAAILSAFLFYLTRAFAARGPLRLSDAAVLGLLAGLAAATKYSGLVALASAAVMIAMSLARQPFAARTARAGAVIALMAIVVGGWKYADNVRRYGTPLFANGSAGEGLALAAVRRAGARYEFATMRLGPLRDVLVRSLPITQLTDFPVYRSVFTTLHAQAWSDMSLFTVAGRHGGPGQPYGTRRIPVALTMTVIVLGLVPEGLAVVGLVVSLRHRLLRPLVVFTLVTLVAYITWVLPQARWALKTKYILSLLPALVVFAVVGQGWLARKLPIVGVVTMTLVMALGIAAHVYMLLFAVT